jgi:hypothetical protein
MLLLDGRFLAGFGRGAVLLVCHPCHLRLSRRGAVVVAGLFGESSASENLTLGIVMPGRHSYNTSDNSSHA